MPNNQEPHLSENERLTLEVIYRWEFEPYGWVRERLLDFNGFKDFPDHLPKTEDKEYKAFKKHCNTEAGPLPVSPVPCELVEMTIGALFLRESDLSDKRFDGSLNIALEVLARYDHIDFSEANPSDAGLWVLSDGLFLEIDVPPVVLGAKQSKSAKVHVLFESSREKNSLGSCVYYYDSAECSRRCCHLTGRGLQRVRETLGLEDKLDDEDEQPSAGHSPDFRSVHWYGTDLTFTPLQPEKVNSSKNLATENVDDVSCETVTETNLQSEHSASIDKRLHVDEASRLASWKDNRLDINSHADFDVLFALDQAKGALVSYKELLEAIKPNAVAKSVTNLKDAPHEVKEAVSHINKALKIVKSGLKVENVRGMGYRLLLPNE